MTKTKQTRFTKSEYKMLDDLLSVEYNMTEDETWKYKIQQLQLKLDQIQGIQ